MTPPNSAAGRLGRRFGSIRVRVVVGYVVLLTAALGISVLVTRQALLNRLDNDVEQQLNLEVEQLRLLARSADPADGEAFGSHIEAVFDTFLRQAVARNDEAFYTLVDDKPFLYSFGAPAALLDDPDLVTKWAAIESAEWRDIDTEAGRARTLAVAITEDDRELGVFIAAHFLDDDRAEIEQIVRIIAGIGLIVLLVSGLVAWSLAGRVLRPIRELTGVARGITDDDLSARIPVDGTDEIAVLGTTFNEMLERLDDGFRGQRQLLDDVAHELRTPITIARGHLDVLGDDPVERAEAVEIVTDELDRMSRYVADLLLLAQSEQPDFLQPEPTDIGELAESIFAKMGALGERCWTDDGHPPPGRSAAVIDPQRVTQAVLNLAHNAVQHTAAQDEIGFGVAVERGQLVLQVRDSGPGVDSEIQHELFERHARSAASRQHRSDGMGIGLSIVDAIARAHGGHADVRSNANGATFEITLPTNAGADIDPSTEEST